MPTTLLVFLAPGTPAIDQMKMMGFKLVDPDPGQLWGAALWCSKVEPEWGAFLALTPTKRTPLGEELQVDEHFLVPMHTVQGVLHGVKQRAVGFGAALSS